MQGQQGHSFAGGGWGCVAAGPGSGGQTPGCGTQIQRILQGSRPGLLGERGIPGFRRIGGNKRESEAEHNQGCERNNGVPEIAQLWAVFRIVFFHNRPWCHAVGGISAPPDR